MSNDVSDAVVAYFRNRGVPTRREREADLAARFPQDAYPAMHAAVQNLISRSFELGSQYSHMDLSTATGAVADDLRGEFPDLAEEAVDALGWYWSFCNR
jgi:hypothetical protein